MVVERIACDEAASSSTASATNDFIADDGLLESLRGVHHVPPQSNAGRSAAGRAPNGSMRKFSRRPALPRQSLWRRLACTVVYRNVL
jgi:hypothetical protein